MCPQRSVGFDNAHFIQSCKPVMVDLVVRGLALLAMIASSDAWGLPKRSMDRRAMLAEGGGWGAATAVVLGPTAANAGIDVSGLKMEPMPTGAPGVVASFSDAPRATKGNAALTGRWRAEDGSSRFVTLLPTKGLGFQLASVEGPDQLGRPVQWNALVGEVARRDTITVDYTKTGELYRSEHTGGIHPHARTTPNTAGGPADYRGVYFAASTSGIYSKDRVEFPDGTAWTRE